MPLTNKKQTLWVLTIIKSCHFECRLEHGLFPECSLPPGCFYFSCWMLCCQCFWVKWAFSLLWIPLCTLHRLYKNDLFTTNPWPSWKDKQMFCCREIKLLLSAGLNVIFRLRIFTCIIFLWSTHLMHIWVRQMLQKKQFYNYNLTLTIHLYRNMRNIWATACLAFGLMYIHILCMILCYVEPSGSEWCLYVYI